MRTTTSGRFQLSPISRKTVFITLLCVGGLFHRAGVNAQSVIESLQQLPEDPATEFVRPLVDAFGANLNTGWINKAPDAEILGLDVHLGVIFMGALVDKDAEIFRLLETLFSFRQQEALQLARNSIPGFDGFDQSTQDAIIEEILNTPFRADVQGPTVFGREEEGVLVRTTDQQIVVDNVGTFTILGQDILLQDVTGLLNNPGIFPTAAPQLTVGTVYGTQVAIRYLPNIKISDDIGELKYLGFGLQHNPLVWLNRPVPVNVSLSFFAQSLKIGDILKETTTAFALHASKTFSGAVAAVTPYAGVQIEKSTMKVDYEYEISPGNTVPIQFELDGRNKSRLILGVGLRVLGINLFADYNIARVNSFGVTLNYGF